MADITFRQQQILDRVIGHWGTYLVSPTVRELVQAIDWCSSTSHMHEELRALIRCGYLVRIDHRSRAIIPVRDCDGTALSVVLRRADGIEVELGVQQ